MSSDLRVAVVGAGPAGIYAANILLRERPDARVDVFESLPAPYGLIRYGVAPDHPRIKGIVTSLHEMLDDERVRLVGNVHIGRDVTVDELRAAYSAVVLATGADRDALSTLPGADLSGSFGAADFVSWYDGHPDVDRDWPLDAAEVAVLGNGNVALDVARVLAKGHLDLLTTDVPENVAARLETSPVTDVHVFGRRGPEEIKFTPIELRELGEVADVDIVLDDADFAHPVDETLPRTNQQKIMARILGEWREREPSGASRRIHLHFFHEPLEIVGDGAVEGIRFARTAPTGVPGEVARTGEVVEYPVGAVYRAIGYRSSPVAGVPFDDAAGVVRNVEGRVVDEAGTHLPGLYATGWIKRGPVGLIGHTKSDAQETIHHLIADLEGAPEPEAPADSVFDLLAERGVEVTGWGGWLALDRHERALGAAFDGPVARERIKVVSREEQVERSRAEELVEP